MPLPLITATDAFERVRDAIAQIIATEAAAQVALGGSGLDVYTERANPWESYLEDRPDVTPIVNVWFESESFSGSQGSAITQQTARGTFNIDCYAVGLSDENTAGDEAAARASHAAARLVRNILMAGHYAYLGMRGVVAKRWVRSITSMPSSSEARPVNHIHACRVAVDVDYIETAPQVDGETIEAIGLDLIRAEDGRILSSLEYGYSD